MQVYTVGYLIFYVEFVQTGNIFRIVLLEQYASTIVSSTDII